MDSCTRHFACNSGVLCEDRRYFSLEAYVLCSYMPLECDVRNFSITNKLIFLERSSNCILMYNYSINRRLV